jgi:hypothetical protein|tara:strand:- start:2738 stop:3115 length:378 start_codon:yes stop_codon:yes gene_type:complete
MSLDGIAAWVKDAKEVIGFHHRLILRDLFISIIDETPVKTGLLKGNWKVDFKAFDFKAVDVKDPSGAITKRDVSAFISSVGAEDLSIFFSNNLPYAYTIEYDGYSRKAPEGMLYKNLIRVRSELE